MAKRKEMEFGIVVQLMDEFLYYSARRTLPEKEAAAPHSYSLTALTLRLLNDRLTIPCEIA